MRIYLVRHGQSTNNAEQPRVADPALTDLGRQQARAAADALARKNRQFAAIYASPMRRAIETAVTIQAALNAPVTLLPSLCEMNGVHWDVGMTREAILNEWPGLILGEGISANGWWTPLEGFEEMEAGYRRAAVALRDLRSRHSHDDTIAVITHGGFGTALIATLLGLPPASDELFLFWNCGITRVDLRREHDPEDPARSVRLTYHNNTAHLSPDMIT
jgi:broad specificity phosphatase PhoE